MKENTVFVTLWLQNLLQICFTVLMYIYLRASFLCKSLTELCVVSIQLMVSVDSAYFYLGHVDTAKHSTVEGLNSSVPPL